MNFNHTSPKDDEVISKIEDNIATSTYEELSLEFQRSYPVVLRAFQLIGLMYNRLTIVDKLSHKKAIVKICEDHKHLQGFSERNIRRSLMSLDNPNIPHRSSRKIRPTWPNSKTIEASDDSSEQEKAELSCNSQTANQDYKLENTKKLNSEKIDDANCPNCNALVEQNEKLQQEKSEVVGGFEQALHIIQKQEQKISEIQNVECVTDNHTKVTDQEIALLYGPLQQAMRSVFNQKENKLWLTIRFSKDAENIIEVYAGRKSKVVHSSQSILTSHD